MIDIEMRFWDFDSFKQVMILKSNSLWVDPVFKVLFIACLAILLKVEDFTLASHANHFSIVDINKYAVIISTFGSRMFFQVHKSVIIT